MSVEKRIKKKEIGKAKNKGIERELKFNEK
jgi:hypothetical protein